MRKYGENCNKYCIELYMYEHGLIYVPYRKATCLHHFYSILSLFKLKLKLNLFTIAITSL